MTYASTDKLFDRQSLLRQPELARNRWNAFFTLVTGLFSLIAVLPLVLVLLYVLIKGGSLISIGLLTQLPRPPAPAAAASATPSSAPFWSPWWLR